MIFCLKDMRLFNEYMKRCPTVSVNREIKGINTLKLDVVDNACSPIPQKNRRIRV
jgi:hypothetical protein